MKRKIVFALCIASAAIAATAASADPMQGRYGNTVQLTNAEGKISRVYFNPDKTVRLKRPDGEEMNGTWEFDGPDVCIKMSMLLVSMRRCMPFVPDKKPGDTWMQKGPDGKEASVTIIAGRN